MLKPLKCVFSNTREGRARQGQGHLGMLMSCLLDPPCDPKQACVFNLFHPLLALTILFPQCQPASMEILSSLLVLIGVQCARFNTRNVFTCTAGGIGSILCFHRIMGWFGLEATLKTIPFQPLSWGTFHSTWLLQASSCFSETVHLSDANYVWLMD